MLGFATGKTPVLRKGKVHEMHRQKKREKYNSKYQLKLELLHMIFNASTSRSYCHLAKDFNR